MELKKGGTTELEIVAKTKKEDDVGEVTLRWKVRGYPFFRCRKMKRGRFSSKCSLTRGRGVDNERHSFCVHCAVFGCSLVVTLT